MTIEEARAAVDLKAVVVYSPGGTGAETGMVTSVSETMAFVRYGADTGSKATRPEDLAFAFAPDAMLARRRPDVS
jgi:hypothetical protein